MKQFLVGVLLVAVAHSAYIPKIRQEVAGLDGAGPEVLDGSLQLRDVDVNPGHLPALIKQKRCPSGVVGAANPNFRRGYDNPVVRLCNSCRKKQKCRREDVCFLCSSWCKNVDPEFFQSESSENLTGGTITNEAQEQVAEESPIEDPVPTQEGIVQMANRFGEDNEQEKILYVDSFPKDSSRIKLFCTLLGIERCDELNSILFFAKTYSDIDFGKRMGADEEKLAKFLNERLQEGLLNNKAGEPLKDEELYNVLSEAMKKYNEEMVGREQPADAEELEETPQISSRLQEVEPTREAEPTDSTIVGAEPKTTEEKERCDSLELKGLEKGLKKLDVYEPLPSYKPNVPQYNEYGGYRQNKETVNPSVLEDMPVGATQETSEKPTSDITVSGRSNYDDLPTYELKEIDDGQSYTVDGPAGPSLQPASQVVPYQGNAPPTAPTYQANQQDYKLLKPTNYQQGYTEPQNYGNQGYPQYPTNNYQQPQSQSYQPEPSYEAPQPTQNYRPQEYPQNYQPQYQSNGYAPGYGYVGAPSPQSAQAAEPNLESRVAEPNLGSPGADSKTVGDITKDLEEKIFELTQKAQEIPSTLSNNRMLEPSTARGAETSDIPGRFNKAVKDFDTVPKMVLEKTKEIMEKLEKMRQGKNIVGKPLEETENVVGQAQEALPSEQAPALTQRIGEETNPRQNQEEAEEIPSEISAVPIDIPEDEEEGLVGESKTLADQLSSLGKEAQPEVAQETQPEASKPIEPVMENRFKESQESESIEDLTQLGKIIHKDEKNVFFLGKGVKLPLKVEHSKDGSLQLSVDIEKLCSCKNSTCPKNHAAIEEAVGTILEKEAELKNELEGTAAEENTVGLASRNNFEESEPLNQFGIGEKGPTQKRAAQVPLEEKHDVLLNPKPYTFNPDKQFTNLQKKLQTLDKNLKQYEKNNDNLINEGTKTLFQTKKQNEKIQKEVNFVNNVLSWMKNLNNNN